MSVRDIETFWRKKRMNEKDMMLTELRKSIVKRMNTELFDVLNTRDLSSSYKQGVRDMYDQIGYIVVSEIEKIRKTDGIDQEGQT